MPKLCLSNVLCNYLRQKRTNNTTEINNSMFRVNREHCIKIFTLLEYQSNSSEFNDLQWYIFNTQLAAQT
jgi:hypothetical protein